MEVGLACFVISARGHLPKSTNSLNRVKLTMNTLQNIWLRCLPQLTSEGDIDKVEQLDIGRGGDVEFGNFGTLVVEILYSFFKVFGGRDECV